MTFGRLAQLHDLADGWCCFENQSPRLERPAYTLHEPKGCQAGRRKHLKGERRLRLRVNQMAGRWQASLRIRTQKDGLSGVVGLDAPHGRPGKRPVP